MNEGGNSWAELLLRLLGNLFDDWMWILLRSELIGALAVGAALWLVSYLMERRHLARLEAREAELQDIAITGTPTIPPGFEAADPALLVASAVLSRGAFRTLLVTIRKLFGGKIQGYTLLLERARREALLRLKEAARERGATTVINLRFETIKISRKGMPAVEVTAYGTALANGPGGAAGDNAARR